MHISKLWKAELWQWGLHCLAYHPPKGPLYPTAFHAAYKHGGLTPSALQAPERSGRSPCSHDLSQLVHRFPVLQIQVIHDDKHTSTLTAAHLWRRSQQFPVSLLSWRPGCLEQKQAKKQNVHWSVCVKQTEFSCGLLFCQNGTEMRATEGATWIHSSFFFSDHWENNCSICRDQQSGRSSREICCVCFILPLEFIRCGQVRNRHGLFLWAEPHLRSAAGSFHYFRIGRKAYYPF